MLPENIKNDFKNIVFEIKQAHNKALQSVNTELLTLYWNIGKIISEKIKNSN